MDTDVKTIESSTFCSPNIHTTHKVPNFLIAGAAKCGTTALANYLDQHPQLFFSPLKEPKFFSSHFLDLPHRGRGDDFIHSFTVCDYEEYLKLFRRARRAKAIGEASVENLYYHRDVIPVIKQYLNDPKIIIMLRNPVDRAFSAYKQLLRDHRETLSFEEGLEQEKMRMTQNYEFLWYYTDVGFYYNQIKSYLKEFSQVKILLFDDFKNNPIDTCKDIFSFLGIRNSFRIKLKPKRNASGVPKNGLYRAILRATPLKGRIYRWLTAMGISDSAIQPLMETVRNGALNDFSMSPETRQKLQKIYQDDILKVSRLLHRDLSHWLM
ncbi:MAG: sulfotransferase family protein [Chitinispirillaceae bacterium]